MKFFAVFSIFFLSLLTVKTGFGYSPDELNPVSKIFINPTKLDQHLPCSPENIGAQKFSNQFTEKDKVKVCEGMEFFIDHSRLAARNASPQLGEQMREVWNTFIEAGTRFKQLPKDRENSYYAASSASTGGDVFRAAVYVSTAKLNNEAFFYTFWHELQHIYDIKKAWDKNERISNYKLEFNGFYFSSELAEAYRSKEWNGRQSGFWRDEWKNLSAEKKRELRTKVIDDFMNKSPVYADTRDRNEAQYDFTSRLQ